MTDILFGVLIGGFIASITPIAMKMIDHKRWQQQLTLEQLRFERQRLERIFRGNLKRLSKAIRENSYPSDMIMDFILTMPKDVSSKFKGFLANPNKTNAASKKVCVDVVLSMKETLSDIDSRIENIIAQKPKYFRIHQKKG
ncbi:MAG: hypothetical protein PVI00_16600 [Desulfobacterales bacterium]|jgi:hypothetical protein